MKICVLGPGYRSAVCAAHRTPGGHAVTGMPPEQTAVYIRAGLSEGMPVPLGSTDAGTAGVPKYAAPVWHQKELSSQQYVNLNTLRASTSP